MHMQALVLYLSEGKRERVNEPVLGVCTRVSMRVSERVGGCVTEEGSPRTHSSGSLGAHPPIPSLSVSFPFYVCTHTNTLLSVSSVIMHGTVR